MCVVRASVGSFFLAFGCSFFVYFVRYVCITCFISLCMSFVGSFFISVVRSFGVLLVRCFVLSVFGVPCVLYVFRSTCL